MKTKVLNVIGNLDIGGAQASLYQLWPYFNRSSRYQVDYLVLNFIGYYGKKLLNEGAIVHNIKSKYKYGPSILIKLSKVIKNNAYQIIHAHLFPELYLVPLSTKFRPNQKLVYTEHSSLNRRRDRKIPFKVLDRYAYSHYQRIIAVSTTTMNNLIEWQPQLSQNIYEIRNGIRMEIVSNPQGNHKKKLLQEINRTGITEQTTILLYAGRLAYPKGCDVLIQALANIKGSNFFCVIAGDGPDRQSLESNVHKLGLSDNISFLGIRNDIPNLLKAVDVVILPSRWEGLPMVMLEAMASGCPIIATAVDGTVDVLKNDVSALLVEPENPLQLSEAISRILNNPAFGRTLAEQALCDVKASYSAEQAARKLINLYDSVLSTEVVNL